MKHSWTATVLASLAIACQFAFRQAVREVVLEDRIASPHASFVGVKECAACHTQPGILYPKLGVTQFVRLTEAAQWFSNDKHAIAYERIRMDLPEEKWPQPHRESIGRTRDLVSKMGWQANDGNFERQCLTCHAGVDPEADLDEIRNSPNLRFGVQCESCHGPGSLYTDTANHQQPAWRTKSSQEKLALGMHDLANAATCGEVCLSCHLGDIDRGRFITHAMYAAGHPPFHRLSCRRFWMRCRRIGENCPPSPIAKRMASRRQRFNTKMNTIAIDFSSTNRSMLHPCSRLWLAVSNGRSEAGSEQW